jgi:hypothetical protein
MSRLTKAVLIAAFVALAMPADARQNFVTNLCPPGVCLGTADQRATEIWSGGRSMLQVTTSALLPSRTGIALGTTAFPFVLPAGQSLPTGCTLSQHPASDGAGGWTCADDVAGTPGGSDTMVQFNDGGSFGGVAALIFNKVTGALTGTGAWAAATLNTGQGANELYAMDQNVRTTDSPTFAAISVTNAEMILTGAGNPQGVTTGAAGRMYRNTTNGRMYLKRGGGSTAYGWYPMMGFGDTAPYQHFRHAVNDSSTPGLGAGWIGFSAAPTGNSLNSHTRTFVTGQGSFGTWSTGTVDGNTSYMSTTGSQLRWWEDDIDCSYVVRTPATITLIRLIAGLSSVAMTDSETLGTASNGAMFIRYSTPASDTGWMGYSSINGASTATSGNLGSIQASTTYKLRIRFVRTGTPTIYYSVNDGTEVAKTDNVPVTGVTAFHIWGATTKESGVARQFLWQSFECFVGIGG